MKLKSYLLTALAFAGAVLTNTSCDQIKEELVPKFQIEQDGTPVTSLTIDAEAEEVAMTVVSNLSWEIVVDADWLSIQPSTNENTTGLEVKTDIALIVLENTAEESRTANVSATVEGISFKLVVTQNGAKAPEPDGTTIPDITTEGEYTLKNVTVVGIYNNGFMVADKDLNAILVYLNKASDVKIGDVVDLKGAVTLYNGNLQFGSETEVTPTGTNSPIEVAYSEIDGAMIESYEKGFLPGIVTGKLNVTTNSDKTKTYYNVDIEGTTKTGSISYPLESLGLDALNGKTIEIKGFALGQYTSGSNTYFYMMANEVTEIETPEPEYKEATIDEITAEGNYIVKNAVVGGLYQRGYIVVDETETAILVYLGANAEYDVKMFDVVNLKGTVVDYKGNLQFAEGTTAEIVGNTVLEYELPEFTSVEIEAYKGGYFAGKITGVLSVSASGDNTFYNVAIDGTEITGSISYPLASLELQQLDKQLVTVEGWSLNTNTSSSGKTYFNMLAVNVYPVEVPPVTDITPIADVVNGNTYLMAGVVTALSTNGFILTDDSASIFCYKNAVTVEMGDKVSILGAISSFNKGMQIDGANATIAISDKAEVVYPEPSVADAKAIDAFVANTEDRLATYVSLTGKLSISGNYYNIIVEGTANQGSIYYATDEIKALLKDGDNVTVKGYAMAVSGVKYYNVIVTEVKVDAPEYTINLTPSSIEWEADAKDNQVITVSIVDASSVAYKDWTVKLDSEEWFQIIGFDTEAGTVTVAPKAVNDSENEITGTLTVSAGTEYATVALNHKKAVAVTPIGDVAEKGTYLLKGVVTALSTNGFILTDDTASIFCYKNAVTVGLGDQVSVDGTITSYNKCLQIDGANATIVITDKAEVVYPEPSIADAAAIDAFVANTENRLATYVSMTGTLSVSGNYYNIIVEGTTNQGSIYYASDAVKASLNNGDNVTVKGYAMAVSGVKYYNIIITDVTVNKVADKISVTPDTHEWAADDLTAKAFNVTATAEWAYSLSEGLDAWLTVGVEGNVITATPKAANTSSTANKGTITLTCGIMTVTIAVKQAGVIVEGEQVIYNATFNNEGDEQTASNNYGADPKTYTVSGVKWTVIYADIVTSGTPINGAANIMMRVAKNKTNSPSATTASLVSADTQLTKLTYKYNAKAGGLNFLSEYSIDGGTTWVEIENVADVATGVTAKEFAFDDIDVSKDIRLRFTVSTDKTTSSNRDFQIDDVVVTGIQ